MVPKAVVAASLLGVASASVAPNIPVQYYVEATMTMPYYNLVEPIRAFYCGLCGVGRLDYWGGTQRYLYNSTGQGYQIVPTTNEDGISSTETCFTTSMNEDPVSVFPDVTNFPTTADDGDCEINGVECVSYTIISPTYNEDTGFDGNYTLYVDATSGIPLRFHFTGFNVVFGSHYDEYIFDYLKVVPNLDNRAPGCFEVPDMDCVQLETDDVGDDAGPTKGGRARRPVHVLDRQDHDLDSILPRDKKQMNHARANKLERFKDWQQKHDKKFGSLKELEDRSKLFHATEHYVNAMNRQHLSYWLGVNHMADWSVEEKKKLRGRKHTPKGYTVDATNTHATIGDDDDIDWRELGAVSPVKDQGSCGSCWSFGAHETTEGQQFLKSGTLTRLSSQNLMDCSWGEGNDACDGGLDTRAYEWMLKQGGGIATESSYPYMNADGYCRFTSSKIGAVITGYNNITTGVDGLNDALNNIGPISVSIDASPDSFYYYQGGYYYDSSCKSGMDNLDHTVLAVGIVTENGQKYSIVKNSWSTHWGDEGYVYISQEDNCCGVATQPTYVTL